MAEAKITRQEVITIVTVESNDYGDLLFTDQNGTGHKISNKRVSYFDIIKQNATVQLNYAEAYNKEYIYNALPVGDQLPPAKAPGEAPNRMVEQAKNLGAVDDKMSKNDWTDKDTKTRKSIERQKSLELAVNLLIDRKDPDEEDVVLVAQRFEKYLETGK